MKVFKIEICPYEEVMGSVGEDDGAFMSTFRVNQNEYSNADAKMIPEAFQFAAELLKSHFKGVDVTESSVSVSFSDGQEEQPPRIVTAGVIHEHLGELGYERKSGV